MGFNSGFKGLKHVVEAKIKRSIKVTGRKGSRRKQLLDDP